MNRSRYPGYLFSLCLKELSECQADLDKHLSYPTIYLDDKKHKKIDIVLGSEVAIEIKFEANYPGVSKPVVFPSDPIAEWLRLKSMKTQGMKHCHFIFLIKGGTHFRNLQKYTENKLNWLKITVRY
ncbi:hypothetical protein DP73_17710 [Desulfosporosinus sp. HMP52]|nr:hypothetical protein DP73_17710 [Desulfosporosinus sp. HMP52]